MPSGLSVRAVAGGDAAEIVDMGPTETRYHCAAAVVVAVMDV